MDTLVEFVIGNEGRSPSARRKEFQVRPAIHKKMVESKPKPMSSSIGELLNDMNPIRADADTGLL